jgi:hypothetical protein
LHAFVGGLTFVGLVTNEFDYQFNINVVESNLVVATPTRAKIGLPIIQKQKGRPYRQPFYIYKET